jgi:uncharacterized membrane protein
MLGPGWLWGLGWIVVVLVLINLSRLFWWRAGPGWGWRRRRYYGPGWGGPYGGYDPADAEHILRQRLARGEIDQAEYDRLLEILRR